MKILAYVLEIAEPEWLKILKTPVGWPDMADRNLKNTLIRMKICILVWMIDSYLDSAASETV